MNDYKQVNITELHESPVQMIGKEWMLITAGNSTAFNTMTASWGGLGELWNKPVAFIFVRPQRYTFDFLEREDYFTLSFYNENYREALTICGTKSGRDTDKVKEAGLTPLYTPLGVAFGEARVIIECRKIYGDFLQPEAFIDGSIAENIYPQSDYHKMYVGEIVNVWKR
ncbi:MAG: flavin reductase [Bacteroidales bacterium]|nr:flavin reductase [Bacteroidales bacterium]MCL2133012.1 flavin reductase [Bacteroidales bacterium]